MEIIIVILALLSQILGLCGFVFSCFLFLKFSSIKGWFNKKAGTEIVSSFSFRSIRTLIITGGLGFIMMIAGMLSYALLFMDETPADAQACWLAGIYVALVLAIPFGVLCAVFGIAVRRKTRRRKHGVCFMT